jgi:cytochrome c553
MKSSVILLFCSISLIAVSGMVPAWATASSGAALAQNVCSACHGPDGNSLTPSFPKLAGQGEAYLIHSLKDFKSGRRSNPIMYSMAQTLTPSEMDSVAHFFSKQKMSPGTANPKLVALGQRIFRGGLPKQGVPACMACHGPDGMGNEPAAYPRLAGQWAPYLLEQLNAFAHGKRKSTNHGMMNYVAAHLTPAQMKAVASYLQGLH